MQDTEQSEDEIEEGEEVCEDCGGSGYVRSMGQVYPGEPHMADVGEERCHCSIREDFEE